MPPEPRTRRNGQPQACEPCRKAKVRCDHGSPKCSRCVMRRLGCIYHPAPMTKPQTTLDGTPSSSGTTPTDFQQTTVSSPKVVAFSSVADASSAASSGASVSYNRAKRTTLFQKESASYETTRFSAVFSENQASFGPAILDVIDDNGQSNGTTSNSNYEPSREGHVTAGPRTELAINTLLNFPTARTCEVLIKSLPYMDDVWMSPVMIQQCLRQIWIEYSSCLGDDRSRASVSAMANDLFENGKQPLPPPDHDSDCESASWRNWFGGPRLRWEMIGILFSWAGMVFKHRQEWDPVFDLPEQQGMDRKTAADKMRECSVACLQLCEDFSEINDIIVCLMKNSCKLQSVIISDESDRLRIDYGTVGSAFITAGLHRLPMVKEVTPLSQYRSLISSSMYYLDKCESLFNGRPPMLSRRYCHCPLPLDLCEEDVYNGRERLAAAVAKLDSNGWNTDGEIYTATWLRALCFLSPIREEILKLSLSVNPQFTKSQVDDLILRLGQIVESYPLHIQYHSNAEWPQRLISCSHGRGAREMYIITRIQLDILQCRFLLQRLLVSRAFSNGQELFNIAHEMISIILSLWLNRDQLQNFNFAFDWITISYGIPCVGILCIELLRASNLATSLPTTDSSTTTTTHAPIQLSRSEVVQTLTMFIAFLNWIRPTDNNAQLCSKVKKVVKRIIDTVFDSPHPFYVAQMQQQQNQQQPPPESQTQDLLQDQQSQQQPLPTTMDSLGDFDPALMSMGDLDWLNTVDWTQGDWLELSQQTFLQ